MSRLISRIGACLAVALLLAGCGGGADRAEALRRPRSHLYRSGALLDRGHGFAAERRRNRCGHASPAGAQRRDAQLHRHRRASDCPRPDQQRAGSLFFLRRLHARRRERRDAAGNVLLQRRPRLVDGVAAPGLVRAQATRDRRSCDDCADAVSAGRQRREPHRRQRPGVRRRGGHRSVRSDRAQRQPDLLECRRRRGGVSRFRHSLSRRQQPGGLAQVPVRRVVRHHPQRGAGEHAGKRRGQPQRRRPAIVGAELQRRLRRDCTDRQLRRLPALVRRRRRLVQPRQSEPRAVRRCRRLSPRCARSPPISTIPRSRRF